MLEIHFKQLPPLLTEPFVGIAEIFSAEISHNHLAKIQEKVFSVGLSILQPIAFPLVVRKPGRNCCKLLLKVPKEDIEEKQEATAILADALFPSGFD